PYLQGLSFAQKAAALGVPAGLDETLTRYPATSEQAFDFDKYVTDEPEAPVATPPASGSVVQSGSWGPFLLSMILDEGATVGALESAAGGWAGDSSVSWTSGSQDCLRIDVAMDTPTQLVALGNALVGWAGRHAGATVVALTDTSLRFTSCVG